MNTITLHNLFDVDGSIPCAPFIFPGGEPHVQLESRGITGEYVWLDCRLGDANGWAMAMATIDAIGGLRPKWFGVAIPYFPAARQDRRTEGAPCTASIYAEQAKAVCAGVETIVVVDAHSQRLMRMLRNSDQELKPHCVMPRMPQYAGIIAPDAGARDRAKSAADHMHVTAVYEASKRRDSATGKLSGFECPPLGSAGRYLIVDDICDGGGTFVGLAKVILEANPGVTLDLWVTHGIFSKPINLLSDVFDTIYTTDSFPNQLPSSPRINVTRLHGYLASAMRRSITC